MSYKVNQQPHISDFDGNPSITFQKSFNRIHDNNELTLKGTSTFFSVAQVVSGQAISQPLPADAGAIANTPSTYDLGDGVERFGVRIRFVTNNLFPTINMLGITDAIPDPFVEYMKGNQAKAEWLSSRHPMAFTENVNGQIPTWGALVVVREYSENYFIERIINTAPGMIPIGGSTAGSFDSWGLGPDASTPHEAHPPCDKAMMPKKWTWISIADMAKTVKSSVSSRSIGISIIAMAITEQPNKGGIGGFNFNHWGIMADLRDWKSAYIKCSVPSTEGAGGSGNRREKIRWFAAFASTAESVKFMADKIKGRTDVDENGKSIGFATVNNGIDWAKLHTLKWLSPSDKRERIKNVSKMKKKGANWDKAEKAYNAA